MTTPALPIVKLQLRQVYGRDLYYPANVPAERFAKLTETKTFKPEQIDLIESLGYKIDVQPYKGESR